MLKNQASKMGKPKNMIKGGPVRERASKYWVDFTSRLRQQAIELGLGPVEVAAPKPKRIGAYERWLEQGMHGEMNYMARSDRVDRRRDLNVVLRDVKSVVMCGLMYWPGSSAFRNAQESKDLRGEVSCYAWGKDYHSILDDRLKTLAAWMHEEAGGNGKWYVDTGAILERDLGEQAGMGFVGKNTMLINPKYGSGFFLGEILSTLPLPPTQPKKMPGCGKCRKCQVACPTDAFSEEYVLDARKCISYLTIELKGEIPEALRTQMGRKVYGCDICQQVCPWNKFDWEGEMKGSSPLFGKVAKDVETPELGKLILMTEAEFQEWFADTAVLRIGRERLRRNAAVALGNTRDPRALRLLEEASGDESELVSSHARWALAHLKSVLGMHLANTPAEKNPCS